MDHSPPRSPRNEQEHASPEYLDVQSNVQHTAHTPPRSFEPNIRHTLMERYSPITSSPEPNDSPGSSQIPSPGPSPIASPKHSVSFCCKRLIDLESRRESMLEWEDLYKNRIKCQTGYAVVDIAHMKHFTPGPRLANGYFGPIHVGQDRVFNFDVALKYLLKQKLRTKSQSSRGTHYEEICTQFELRHKNILKLYGFCEDSRGYYLILELAQQQTLYDLMLDQPDHRIPELHAAYQIGSLADALAYMHWHDVYDRDLRPTSILLGFDGELKISDFGCTENDRLLTAGDCGLVDYRSPEYCGSMDSVKPSVDIWRLGVLCFEMLTGMTPFDHNESDMTPLNRMMTATFVVPDYISELAKDLLQRLIVAKAEDRIGLRRLATHPWFSFALK